MKRIVLFFVLCLAVITTMAESLSPTKNGFNRDGSTNKDQYIAQQRLEMKTVPGIVDPTGTTNREVGFTFDISTLAGKTLETAVFKACVTGTGTASTVPEEASLSFELTAFSPGVDELSWNNSRLNDANYVSASTDNPSILGPYVANDDTRKEMIEFDVADYVNQALSEGKTSFTFRVRYTTGYWAENSSARPIMYLASITYPTTTYRPILEYTLEAVCEDNSSSFQKTICESATPYALPSGKTVAASGQYLDTIANACGKDSVITVDLTVIPSTVSFTGVICEAGVEDYFMGYNTVGTHTPPTATINGCPVDSTIVVSLAIPTDTIEINDTVCPGVEVRGEVIPGIYYQKWEEGKCDTIVKFTLSNHPLPTVPNLGEDKTIKLGESITLDAGAGYSSYLWSSKAANAATQTVNVDANVLGLGDHEFSVIVTNEHTCEATDTVKVSVVDNYLVLVADRDGYIQNTNATKTEHYINVKPTIMLRGQASAYNREGHFGFSIDQMTDTVKEAKLQIVYSHHQSAGLGSTGMDMILYGSYNHQLADNVNITAGDGDLWTNRLNVSEFTNLGMQNIPQGTVKYTSFEWDVKSLLNQAILANKTDLVFVLMSPNTASDAVNFISRMTAGNDGVAYSSRIRYMEAECATINNTVDVTVCQDSTYTLGDGQNIVFNTTDDRQEIVTLQRTCGSGVDSVVTYNFSVIGHTSAFDATICPDGVDSYMGFNTAGVHNKPRVIIQGCPVDTVVTIAVQNDVDTIYESKVIAVGECYKEYCATGTYYYKLKENSCDTLVKLDLSVVDKPDISLSINTDTTIKLNQWFELDASSPTVGISRFTWSSNVTTTVNNSKVFVDANKLGLGAHYVWVEVSKDGISNRDSLAVSVANWGTNMKATSSGYVRQNLAYKEDDELITRRYNNQDGESYIFFDISTLPSVVSNMKLNLYCYEAAGGTDDVVNLLASTSVPSIPLGTTWAQKPSESDFTDLYSSVFAAPGNWLNFDVSGYINAAKTAGKNIVAFKLTTNIKSGTASNALLKFRGAYTADESFRPSLTMPAVCISSFASETLSFCEGGSVVVEGQTITQSGEYRFRLPNSCGEDSTRAYKVTEVISNVVENAVICVGESYRGISKDTSFVINGQLGGCPSDTTVNIQVKTPTYIIRVDDVTICEGENYWGKTESGTYYISNRENACDSAIQLQLTVLPSPQIVMNDTVFYKTGQVVNLNIGEFTSYKWYMRIGNVDSLISQEANCNYRISTTASFGNYKLWVTVSGSNGCESTDTTILNISDWYDAIYPTLSGHYNKDKFNVNVMDIRLFSDGENPSSTNFRNVFMVYDVADVQDTFTLAQLSVYRTGGSAPVVQPAALLMSTTDYTSDLQSDIFPNKEDFTEVGKANIENQKHALFDVTSILNDAIKRKMDGEAITKVTFSLKATSQAARVYLGNMTNSNTSYRPHLRLYTDDCIPQELFIDTTICESETFLVNGLTTNVPGVYIENHKTHCDADSIVTIDLKVTKSFYEDSVSICKGDKYLGYNNTGTYYIVSQQGRCPVTRKLNLKVIETPDTMKTNVTLCQGQNYKGITKEGTYILPISSTRCDTVEEVTIAVNPIPVFSIGNDTTIRIYQEVTFYADPGFTSYYWMPTGLSGDSCHIKADPSISIGATKFNVGKYNIIAEVSNSLGCKARDTAVLTISDEWDYLLTSYAINLALNPTIAAGESSTANPSTLDVKGDNCSPIDSLKTQRAYFYFDLPEEWYKLDSVKLRMTMNNVDVSGVDVMVRLLADYGYTLDSRLKWSYKVAENPIDSVVVNGASHLADTYIDFDVTNYWRSIRSDVGKRQSPTLVFRIEAETLEPDNCPVVKFYGGLSVTAEYRKVRLLYTIDENATSVRKSKEVEGLVVYPVPVRDVLTIAVDNPEQYNAYIVNINGGMVKSYGKLTSNTISVGDLPRGLYIVVLENNGKRLSAKILKE